MTKILRSIGFAVMLFDFQSSDDMPWELGAMGNTDVPDNPLEDVVYLLVTIIEQARDQFLQNQHRSLTLSKNKSKFKMQFNAATTKLVETVRKDKECLSLNLNDDTVLVKTILKWLYRGLEQNKGCLKPVLSPYLSTLFQASHSVSWHLESIKNSMQTDEIEALGTFAHLVNTGKITPAQGLLDSVAKNWNWAKNMLKMIEQGNLRLIFVPGRGEVYRHILSLPNSKRNIAANGSKTLQSAKLQNTDCKRLTLPNRNYFNSILKQSKIC